MKEDGHNSVRLPVSVPPSEIRCLRNLCALQSSTFTREDLGGLFCGFADQKPHFGMAGLEIDRDAARA